MEAVKKERSTKARRLTRRVKELDNAIQNGVATIEVKEKISSIKYTIGELGDIQDKLTELVDENDVDMYTAQMKWYDEYDGKVNRAIAQARTYIEDRERGTKCEGSVKLSKLSIPVFEADPKKYLKWRSTFERYTDRLDNDIKYDYLLTSTKGRSRDLVANRGTYHEAIASLDKEFGNKHIIMGLLIDDIRMLPVVRRRF